MNVQFICKQNLTLWDTKSKKDMLEIKRAHSDVVRAVEIVGTKVAKTHPRLDALNLTTNVNARAQLHCHRHTAMNAQTKDPTNILVGVGFV